VPELFGSRGAANSVVFVERYAERNGGWAGKQCRIQGAAAHIDFAAQPPGEEGEVAHAFTAGICQAGMGDGTVRTFESRMSAATFRWACDPRASEAVPADW
jgi:hypothetical protein